MIHTENQNKITKHHTKSVYPNTRISIAPMMGRTDKHFRYFMRLITKKTMLYSEMITTHAILNGNKNFLLDFNVIHENPVSLQLGGNDPDDLAHCCKISEDYGYKEINLNVGCPSPRVQKGLFGASLMSKPYLVASCLEKMQKSVSIPVTVKHRIGIENLEAYEDLHNFIKIISENSDCQHFIIHARIALLHKLSAQENRTIPPLRYHDVYCIKKAFPHLYIEINGGINSILEIKNHLKYTDAIMIGRQAYDSPFLFSEIDSTFFGEAENPHTRIEILELMYDYLEQESKKGTYLYHILRHFHGLFAGQKGSKIFRQELNKSMQGNKYSLEQYQSFLNHLSYMKNYNSL